MMWRRERVNNPSKCAILLMNKQKQQDAIHTYKSTSDRLPTLDLTVQEQQWRNDKWSKNKERED